MPFAGKKPCSRAGVGREGEHWPAEWRWAGTILGQVLGSVGRLPGFGPRGQQTVSRAPRLNVGKDSHLAFCLQHCRICKLAGRLLVRNVLVLNRGINAACWSNEAKTTLEIYLSMQVKKNILLYRRRHI